MRPKERHIETWAMKAPKSEAHELHPFDGDRYTEIVDSEPYIKPFLETGPGLARTVPGAAREIFEGAFVQSNVAIATRGRFEDFVRWEAGEPL